MATVYWFNDGEPFGIEVSPNASVEAWVENGVVSIEFARKNAVPVTLILPYEAAMRTVNALLATALVNSPLTMVGERPSTPVVAQDRHEMGTEDS